MKPSSPPAACQRRLEVGDVGLDRVAAYIGERTHANRPGCRPGTHVHPRCRVGIGGGEPHPIAPTGGVGQHDFAGPATPRRHVVQVRGRRDRAHPGAGTRSSTTRRSCDSVPHRLAAFAVAWNIDAKLSLAAHDIVHRRSKRPLECGRVGLAGLASPVRLDQVVWARQAPGMAGDDAIGTGPHDDVPFTLGLR